MDGRAVAQGGGCDVPGTSPPPPWALSTGLSAAGLAELGPGTLPDVDVAAAVADLLDRQHGVISRRQLCGVGVRPGEIERHVRRKEWVRLLPGVFVNHTGEPTWLQRAWGGVLYLWPAALAHGSALRAAAGPGWRLYDDAGPIQILVSKDRHVPGPVGYSVKRVVSFQDKVQWNLAPPRMRMEEAAIEVASAAKTEHGAIAVLADVCQSRRTTAGRLLTALERRTRLPRRKWLLEVLSDIADGTCSVLERGYLTRIERPHGLPRARRQAAETSDSGPLYRDVDYAEFGLLVELDGRLFHNSAGQRDRDLERDLDAAADGRRSVRLGWGQVFGRECRTAGKIAALLRRRGWRGSPHPCGPDCTIDRP